MFEILSKRFLILLTLIDINILAAVIVSAQSPADAYLLACKWYDEQNYEQATLEAKRAVFFNDSLKIPGYKLLAECCIKMSLYDEAIQYLETISEKEQHDSLFDETLFRIVHLYLINEKPANALITLSELHSTGSEYFTNKSHFYHALAYFQINDFVRSEIHLKNFLSSYSSYDSCYIQELFRRASKNASRNTFIPMLSSALIPGSGQLIEGYYKEGVNAFLLNSLLAGITIFTFYRVYPLDAILTMYPFVRRYYLSNIFNAKEIAIEKHDSTKIEIYNELLDYISQLTMQ